MNAARAETQAVQHELIAVQEEMALVRARALPTGDANAEVQALTGTPVD